MSYRLEPHTTSDKYLRISGGPADILVDFDDVDQGAALAQARNIRDLLNQVASRAPGASAAIRVRKINQEPVLYLVDKLDPKGIRDSHELLTLSPTEILDARAALDAAIPAPPGAYIVGHDGRAEVDRG